MYQYFGRECLGKTGEDTHSPYYNYLLNTIRKKTSAYENLFQIRVVHVKLRPRYQARDICCTSGYKRYRSGIVWG